MNILIFASLKEKKVLQQIMNWSKVTHIKFQMTFVTQENQIRYMIYNNKAQLVIVNNKKAAKILKKLKKKFLYIKNDWYAGVKHENWG